MAENNKTVRPEDAQDNLRVSAGKRPGTARTAHRRAMFNIFDVIVILLVVAVVALAIVGLSVGELFSDEETVAAQMSYSVRISGIDESFAGELRAGQTVCDADTGAVVGQIVSAPTVVRHREPALVEENGTLVAQMQDVPGCVDVTVTLTVEATHESGRGYFVGSTPIRVGQGYTLRFPDYLGRAVCVSIDRITELAQ